MYPQSPGGGEFLPTLAALQVAWLITCVANPESGLCCRPMLAEWQSHCLSAITFTTRGDLRRPIV